MSSASRDMAAVKACMQRYGFLHIKLSVKLACQCTRSRALSRAVRYSSRLALSDPGITGTLLLLLFLFICINDSLLVGR